MNPKQSVDIVVERQWHAPTLAKALLEAGMLGHVHTNFPRHRYTASGLPPQHLRCNPLPALWNYGVHRFGLPKSLTVDEPRAMAGFYLSRPSVAPVVVCFATSYQFIFPRILDRPILRVIDCGSMHPEDHFLFQQRGRREAGLSFSTELPAKVKTEIEASKLAHLLVCGSQMVADSYIRRGYSAERVLICPYGVDTERFSAVLRSPPVGRPIRIATVGIIGIRKGILRLLRIADWARERGLNLEFHLIGPIEPEATAMLEKSQASCVRHGVLKGAKLVEALHHADLYCLPSYEEGFPISQLEAMATGLPAITSADTGGREAVDDGADGIILSAFDAAEFDARLSPLFNSPNRLPAMGERASEKIILHYSVKCYARRTADIYQASSSLVECLLADEKLSTCHVS